MKQLILTTICAATLFNVAAETPEIPAWQQLKYQRGVIAPTKAGTLGFLQFDHEVFSHLNQRISDFRILDAAKQEVPYVIKNITVTSWLQRKVPATAKIISLTKYPASNKIEMIIETPKEFKSAPVGELELETDQKNFEKSITVSGSNNRKTWTLLRQNASFCDFSKIVDLRITNISWTPAKYKYYKLEIGSFQELNEAPSYSMLVRENRNGYQSKEMSKFVTRRDIRINRIVLYTKTEKGVPESYETRDTEYPIKMVGNGNKEGRTMIEFTNLSCPLTALTIKTASGNFSRQVMVERIDDKDQTRLLASGNIRSFKLPGYVKENLKISFNETRAKKFRITIINNDSPPLKDISITAAGPIYQAVFLTAGLDTPLTVYYGGDVPNPVYDVAEAINRLKSPSTSMFTWGKQADNPDFKVIEKVEPRDYKWLVWIAIGVVALILILILGHNVKKFDDMEKE